MKQLLSYMSKWSQPIMAGIASVALFAVVGAMIYTETGKSEHVIVIDLQDNADPFVVLPQLMPGEQITQIREVDRSKAVYQVRVKTKKEKKNLLEWLLGIDKVENAKYDDDD